VNKLQLLQLIGDKCSICGYNKCLRGLHFHHIKPPSDGLWEWRRGSKKVSNALSNLPEWLQLEQVDKVITLCANCHAEVHDGLHPDVPCPPTRKPKSSEQDEPEVVKEEVTLWDNLSTKGKQK